MCMHFFGCISAFWIWAWLEKVSTVQKKCGLAVVTLSSKGLRPSEVTGHVVSLFDFAKSKVRFKSKSCESSPHLCSAEKTYELLLCHLFFIFNCILKGTVSPYTQGWKQRFLLLVTSMWSCVQVALRCRWHLLQAAHLEPINSLTLVLQPCVTRSLSLPMWC